jgi:hypothetical protein
LRPARVVFINQYGSLGRIHGLDPYLRRLPVAHSPARGIPASRDPSPSGRALSANGHAEGNFEYVPVWRFGNSRARPLTDLRNRPISCDSGENSLLGRFGAPTLP